MKRVYLGLSLSRQPMQIDCTREYSPAVYRRLSEILAKRPRRGRVYEVVKRLFDLVVSLFLLFLLAPLMAVIAIVVYRADKGSVIFCQERIGKDGKPFVLYKFRTMTPDAPPSCPTGSLDDRDRFITPVGKILRRFSLDELPQLVCVFRGDMSLVGYRPLVREDALCHHFREKLGVYTMRPGMTGYAQIMGRDEVSDINKAFLDAYYVKNARFRWDIRLLFQTVFIALSGRGNRDAG